MKTIYTLITVCYLSLMVTEVWAKNKMEDKKVIEKSFNVPSDVLLDLSNKYGDVKINTWNSNKINVRAEITVSAGSQELLDETMNRISIDFEQGSNYLEVKTLIAERQDQNWGWNWGNKKNSYCYNVHYTIDMPMDGSVDIYNKYGDIDLDEINGGVDIELKYGDLETKDINNNLELDLGYGNADIGNIQNVDMNIKYSNIEVITCDQFELESKYSSYEIESVEVLDIYDSKYDKYRIDEIGKLESDNKYTSFNIKRLNDELDIDCSYGNLRIAEVGNNFTVINIDCAYTPIEIDINERSGAKVKVENSYGSIDYPEAGSGQLDYIKDGNEKTLNGTIGNGLGVITIYSKYGSIDIE